MQTSIKTYIALMLSVVSILANCQGVKASSRFFERSDVFTDISASEIEAPIQINRVVDPGKAESVTLANDKYPGRSQSRVQFNQDPQGETGLKKQWALEQIQALPSPQIAGSNTQIRVAVLDTGIDRSHEDLHGKVMAEINFTESATTSDIYGHGTHIAGIIAADSENCLGIVGLAPESLLLNVKVADDTGRCQPSALADGIVWAVNNGANIINISIELRESTSELQEAIDYAWRNGAIIIAAAGNDGGETPVYPAGYENCLGVAAIQETGALAPLSNYGNWVDVAAPGFNIYSTLPNNSYGYKHGTSFATAYVSGLAALLFPLVTDTNGDHRLNDEVRQVIESGCRDIGVEGAGRGCINVTNSLVETALINKALP
jgi:thermitase